MNKMGQRIKDKREEAGLSQEELGQKLGVQRQAIYKWEKGEVTNIKRSYIAQMAQIFECDPVWLMGFENAPNVSLTYHAPGEESVMTTVDQEPIIGQSAQISKRARLLTYAAALSDSDLDAAIAVLKSLIDSRRKEE